MYRSLLGLIIAICLAFGAHSQQSKTINTSDSTIEIYQYKTGKRSADIRYAKASSYWKRVNVYDIHGEIVYTRDYGRKWGSSHVELKFRPEGGVSTARYTMQPDGGIQYFDVTTYFTGDGKVDHEEDRSLGDNGQPRLNPNFTHQEPAIILKPVKPNECIPVPASVQVHLINYTSEILHVRYQFRDIVNSGPAYLDIEPSDTTKLGIYYPKGNDQNPLDHYSVSVETKAKNRVEYRIANAGGNNDVRYLMVICRKIRAGK
jgi:hypothetical protein